MQLTFLQLHICVMQCIILFHNDSCHLLVFLVNSYIYNVEATFVTILMRYSDIQA